MLLKPVNWGMKEERKKKPHLSLESEVEAAERETMNNRIDL